MCSLKQERPPSLYSAAAPQDAGEIPASFGCATPVDVEEELQAKNEFHTLYKGNVRVGFIYCTKAIQELLGKGVNRRGI